MSLILDGSLGVTVNAGTAALPAVVSATGTADTGLWFPAADTVAASTGGTERMRIDASGNVGIGTSSPATKLHLLTPSATAVALRLANSASYAEFQVDASGNSQLIAPGGVQIFNTNGAERARIDSSGNVLVGTTTDNITAVGVRLRGDNIQVAKSGDWSLRVGRTTSTGIIQEIYYNSSRVGDIATNGTGTTYNSASDYRLKENIQPMTGALARNALLNPVKYKWKVDGSDGEGFIADQLQGPFPSAVTGEKDAVDADGNPIYQSIGTGPLDGHFAACVNELQTIIQELKAIIDTQAAQIAALNAKVGIYP